MERRPLATDDVTTAQLLDECRNGSREAMHRLYLAYQQSVFSVALNFFGDRDRAEDVTQQVFLKLLKGLSFAGRSQFTTWLYRLTVNQCLDEARRNRRLVSFGEWFSMAEPITRMSLSDQVDSRALSREVQTAVSGLKPKYRIPIVLRYVEGLSYQEIATVLEVSVGTVSSRMNRGHKLLAAKLAHVRGQVQ